MGDPPRLELFHAIADPGSAAARRLLVERGLVEKIVFRNVTYPEAAAAHATHGGGAIPALWDGERLHAGRDAVLARLAAL